MGSKDALKHHQGRNHEPRDVLEQLLARIEELLSKPVGSE
jgi:hypothetical protein